jgi:hypothetical protein
MANKLHNKPLPGLIEDRKTQVLNNFDIKIENLLIEAYNQGRIDEREITGSVLVSTRNLYNQTRGGSQCNKPYLQTVNAKIEVLDELIKLLHIEVVETDYQVKNDGQ